jgi:hypothetical protein
MVSASWPTSKLWVLVGIAGVLAGAGIGIASNGHTKTVTARSTTTTVRTARLPAHMVTYTHTVMRTVTQTHTVLEPSHTVSPKPMTFSGDGFTVLGVVNVPQASNIRWHAHGYFYLGTKPEGYALQVSEKGTSGKAEILGHTYEHVRVDAPGKWSFTIVSCHTCP